ncbi:MAG: hypothetical protein ACM359_17305 [Bacillota bacterium]
MKRKLLNVLAALSLVLCPSFAGLWIRSCYVWDSLSYCIIKEQGPPIVTANYILASERGAIDCELWQTKQHPMATLAHFASWPLGQIKRYTSSPRTLLPFRWFRFAHARPNNLGPRMTLDIYQVRIPSWFPCLLTAIPPALWLRQTHRQRKREKLGLCPTCGYDLRASQTRCPECGSPIPAPRPLPENI